MMFISGLVHIVWNENVWCIWGEALSLHEMKILAVHFLWCLPPVAATSCSPQMSQQCWCFLFFVKTTWFIYFFGNLAARTGELVFMICLSLSCIWSKKCTRMQDFACNISKILQAYTSPLGWMGRISHCICLAAVRRNEPAVRAQAYLPHTPSITPSRVQYSVNSLFTCIWEQCILKDSVNRTSASCVN